MTTHRDRGSTTILMMAVLAIGTSLAVHLSDLGHTFVLSARAQSIADAVALAGAHGSRLESEHIALENGALLVRYEVSKTTLVAGSTVRVTIELEGRRADAWASDEG